MKIYLKVCEKLTYSDIFDFELLGIYTYFKSFDLLNEVSASEVCSKFNIEFTRFRVLLDKLISQDIIKVNIIENDNIIIELSNKKQVEKSPVNKESIENLFLLNTSVNEKIFKMSIVDDRFDETLYKSSLYTIVLKKNYNVSLKYIINSQAEYLEFLNKIHPVELITNASMIQINFNQFEFIYNCCVKLKFSKSLINLVIDYTINKNEYNNFNYKYATKVAYNWNKNNILNVEQALVFIQEVNKKIENKNDDNVFEQPIYETQEISPQINSASNLSIEQMLDKAYE